MHSYHNALQAWAHILLTTKWYADTAELKATTRQATRFEPIGFDVVELDSSSMNPYVDRRWIGAATFDNRLGEGSGITVSHWSDKPLPVG